MATYIVGYAVIIFIVAFVVFSILVKKRVLFGNTIAMQRIFGHPLLHYSLKRIGSALISIALAVLVTFFLIRIAQPPDKTCATLITDPRIVTDPDKYKMACDAWKETMGFSGSIAEQLFRFLYAIIPLPKLVCLTEYSGELGQYTISGCRTFVMDLGRIYGIGGVDDGTFVLDYMFQRMGISFKIGIFATILELALGYPFGILMAKFQNGVFDKIGKGYIILIDAIPGVAYYYLWMAIFCGLMKMPSSFDADNVASYLPAILTMGVTGMSGIGLWVRRYMVDEFNADYVKFARSKGLSENRIMGIHILRNAVVPLVRTFPSAVIGALLGSYYIENIYMIPGIGRSLMIAQDKHNVWLMQGIIIFSALLSVISYILGDIVTALVDPRISFES